MKTVEQLAREADIEFGDFQWIAYDTDLQRFHDLAIAQYRESLLAGVGEPQKIEQTDQYGDAYGYTADQMAAAVAIERERCAKVCEQIEEDEGGNVPATWCAAAIRGQR